MFDSFVMPLPKLVKCKDLLRAHVSVHHVQVNAVSLSEEQSPRGAPVVVPGNGNKLLYRNPLLSHSAKGQVMHSEELSFREQVHLHNEHFLVC